MIANKVMSVMRARCQSREAAIRGAVEEASSRVVSEVRCVRSTQQEHGAILFASSVRIVGNQGFKLMQSIRERSSSDSCDREARSLI